MEFKASNKYYRMIRSHECLRVVATNTGNSISLSQAKEAVEDFFNHCYHLKDWLIKEFPHLKQKIENHISNSIPLSLAADHCNSFKHAGLSTRPRSGKNFESILQHTKIDLTTAGFVSSAQVEIKTTDGTSYKALDLATKCIQDWDTFLHSHQIIIPPP